MPENRTNLGRNALRDGRDGYDRQHHAEAIVPAPRLPECPAQLNKPRESCQWALR